MNAQGSFVQLEVINNRRATDEPPILMGDSKPLLARASGLVANPQQRKPWNQWRGFQPAQPLRLLIGEPTMNT